LPKHARWWEDLAPNRDTRMLRPESSVESLGPEVITLPALKWDPSNVAAKKVFTVGVTVMDVIPE
jgi:hypothetical protein